MFFRSIPAFIVAVVLRFVYLAYNLSWHLPAEWVGSARMALVAAQVRHGVAPSYSDFTAADAVADFLIDDRGILFFHDFFLRIFGSSSLFHLQVFNVLVDALMVFPMFYLGRELRDTRLGVFCAYAYALFLPSIFVSVNPMWYAALSAGAILLLAQAIYLFRNPTFSWRRLTLHSSVVLGLTFVVSQFRSTIIFYPLFLAVIAAVFFRGRMKLLSSSMVIGGLCALLMSSLANYSYSGILIPTRSNTGHCFWIGVGEFKNPYGLRESDASVGDFYQRTTGKKLDYNDMVSFRDYETWLKARAIEFVKSHPGLYSSMVARRALKVVFPNFRIQRVADEEAYAHLAEKSRNERLAITKTGKLFSWSGLQSLWSLDPAFFFELLIRTFFFFALPMGVVMAAWKMRKDPLLAIYASGLIYAIATLAPLRGPAMNQYSAWSATLPLAVLGLVHLASQAMALCRPWKFWALPTNG